jgi:hypothetical protein
MTQPASKSTWGRREPRSFEELNKLCGEAFKQLTIPKHWKFIEYDRCHLTTEPDSEIQSIGAWFLDTKTSGINTKKYRVIFHTYSERIHLLQVGIKDFGKYEYNSIASYKTPEQINEIIKNI